MSLCVVAFLMILVMAWALALKIAQSTGTIGAQFAHRLQPDQLSDDQFQPPSLKHWFGTVCFTELKSLCSSESWELP
jgi:hypothetical protein